MNFLIFKGSVPFATRLYKTKETGFIPFYSELGIIICNINCISTNTGVISIQPSALSRFVVWFIDGNIFFLRQFLLSAKIWQNLKAFGVPVNTMNQWSNFLFLTPCKRLQKIQLRLNKTYSKISQLETDFLNLILRPEWPHNCLSQYCWDCAFTSVLLYMWFLIVFQHRDAKVG